MRLCSRFGIDHLCRLLQFIKAICLLPQNRNHYSIYFVGVRFGQRPTYAASNTQRHLDARLQGGSAHPAERLGRMVREYAAPRSLSGRKPCAGYIYYGKCH